MQDIQLMLEQYEAKTINEYNEAIEQIELRDAEIEKQERMMREMMELDGKKDTALAKMKEQLVEAINQNAAIKKASIKATKDTTSQSKQLKDALKSNREFKKRLEAMKSSNSELRKRNDRLIRESKSKLNKETGELVTIFKSDEEQVMINPRLCDISFLGGERKEDITLLYTRRNGALLMTALAEDGNVYTASPFIEKHGLAQRTIDRICPKPSEEANDFMRNWLYTVTVEQKGINREDLILVNKMTKQKA